MAGTGRRAWLAAVVCVVIAACGPGMPMQVCAPNVTQACACPGGGSGIQACNGAGTGFSPCGACPGDDGGTGGDACSAAHPAGSCPAGQTCLNGSCCDQPCAGSCCTAGSLCVQDAAGNQSCAQRCDTTPDCPGAPGMRCCVALNDATTHAPLAYGACGTFVAGATECRCNRGSDCNSGACAPSLSPTNNPQNPYRCITAGTCTPYGTCSGLGSCPTGYCNLCDARGNCFCAQSCSNDSMCGGAHCELLGSGGTSCSDLHGCVP